MVDIVPKEGRHINEAVHPRVIYNVYNDTVWLLDFQVLVPCDNKIINTLFFARSASNHLRKEQFALRRASQDNATDLPVVIALCQNVAVGEDCDISPFMFLEFAAPLRIGAPNTFGIYTFSLEGLS